jgi:hypothetical protein
LSVNSVAPTTEKLYRLYIGITDHFKYSKMRKYHTQFQENLSVCLKVIRGDRRTYVTLLYAWHFL